MAAESEALAGQNLKTAIAWRIARAEVLAARGELDAGTALAAEAVEIAAATDLVLDHADACVVLADLLRALGRHERCGTGAGRRRAGFTRRRARRSPPSGSRPPERRDVVSTAAPARQPSSAEAAPGTRSGRAENTATRCPRAGVRGHHRPPR